LLGLAFHPDYANNGFFYVDYTDVNGNTVVARYAVSAKDPNLADPTSAQTVLTQEQPFSNHNGGQLAFGPDGYLYIALGDGGSGGDPQENGQNLQSWLGKILRVDIDGDDFPGDPDRNYAVPPDNPFVSDPDALDEIWAYGVRNPWRCTFDRVTGDFLSRMSVRGLGKKSTSSRLRALEEKTMAGTCWKECTASRTCHREAATNF